MHKNFMIFSKLPVKKDAILFRQTNYLEINCFTHTGGESSFDTDKSLKNAQRCYYFLKITIEMG